MSWGTYTLGTSEEIKGLVEGLMPPQTEPSVEVEDQIKAARAAAMSLLDSGCVGAGEFFSVSISGHANPDHKPADGWANDSVSVNVRQATMVEMESFKSMQEKAQEAQNA